MKHSHLYPSFFRGLFTRNYFWLAGLIVLWLITGASTLENHLPAPEDPMSPHEFFWNTIADNVADYRLAIYCRDPEPLGCNPDHIPSAHDLIAAGYVSAYGYCGRPKIVTAFPPITGNLGCHYWRKYFFKAIDYCGNVSEVCVVSVHWVRDTEPPIITCEPDEIDLGCNPTLPTPEELIEQYVTAEDNCSEVEIDYLPGDVLAIGCERVWTIGFVATDRCGNESDPCGITLRWTVDNQAPTILCAAPVIDLGCNPEEFPEPEELAIQYIIANDNCGIDDIKVLPTDIVVFGCEYTISWPFVAVDKCGNESDICFITVTWTVDNRPPLILSCPPGGNLGCNPPALPGPNPGAVVAIDNCGDVDIQVFPSSSTDGCNVTLVYEYVATDECGQSSSCKQTYTYVTDEEPPIILCTAPVIDLGCNPEDDEFPDPEELAIQYIIANDNCGIADIEVLNTDIVVVGCRYTLSWPFRAVDRCGNESDICFITVTWTVDEEPPVIDYCPPLVNLGCNPDIPDPDPDVVQVSDNCGVDYSQTTIAAISSIGPNCQVSLVYIYTFYDFCGNSVECRQRFSYVQDDDGPVIEGVPADLTITCFDRLPPAPRLTATDACTASAITFSEQVRDIDNGYQLIRTWKATDRCGNMTTETQTITVLSRMSHLFGYRTPFCGSAGNQLYVSPQGGQPPYSYQWQLVSGGGMITGGANTSGIVYTAGASTMVFKVTITDAAGCVYMASVAIGCNSRLVEGGESAVEIAVEKPKDKEINLYPNPLTRGLLRVDLGEWGGSKGELMIFDALGRPVYRQAYTELPLGVFEIELYELSAGLYSFRLLPEDEPPVTRQLLIIRD